MGLLFMINCGNQAVIRIVLAIRVIHLIGEDYGFSVFLLHNGVSYIFIVYYHSSLILLRIASKEMGEKFC